MIVKQNGELSDTPNPVSASCPGPTRPGLLKSNFLGVPAARDPRLLKTDPTRFTPSSIESIPRTHKPFSRAQIPPRSGGLRAYVHGSIAP
jgi:hypothetical protein